MHLPVLQLQNNIKVYSSEKSSKAAVLKTAISPFQTS